MTARRTTLLAGGTAAAALLPLPALAADAFHLDGAGLGLAWVLPFAGLLLSIAVCPLFLPRFWHHHYGKVSLFWSLCVLLPMLVAGGPALTLYEVLHTALLEFIPFIILLLALFTVTGGLRVVTSARGTPAFNTGLLAFGTVLASWTGTTGAAMALIRPLLRANAHRAHQAHVVVFFIFLVANVGGALTPLGDPPLFLGFLKGVPFFWPTVHLLLPMVVAAVLLLAVFFALDSWYARREPAAAAPAAAAGGRLRIEGNINLILLLGIIGAVLLSGTWRSGIGLTVFHVEVMLEDIVRSLLLLLLAAASLVLTPRAIRQANEFSWFPMVEVAKLFAGIFITIVPALAILRAGRDGALALVVDAVTGADGQPIDAMYFWLTGLLSSFLDNAPTYLVFFNIAGGDPAVLTGPLATTLAAISAGAVFMGANTYIGNAPNFMVRAIAEEQGVRMPSFFGYMGWSVAVLIPTFALLTLLFFR
ncbi:MAG: sodium:proton antiporter [Geminicoccaceae bacterium]